MSRASKFMWLCVALLVCGNARAVAGQKTSWTASDIGAVAVSGSAGINPNRIRIAAEGTDIWSTADGFFFVYQPLAGNAEITARLASLENTDGWAKAGLMVRQGLAPGSANASLLVTPANGIAFQQRAVSDGQTIRATTAGTAPAWLRLARSGGNVTAFRSNDGVTWTTISTASVPLQGTVYVGVAVTSRRASELASAVFDNVKISAIVAPPPRGPVAAWAFDEGIGSIARDSIGQHHGIVQGAAWTSVGRYGGALSFDGLDDAVIVTDSALLDLSSALTVEAWVLPATLSGWRSVATKEAPGGVSYALYANSDGARPAGVLNTGGSEARVSCATQLPFDVWSHIAVTYDGQMSRLFVNGVQAGSQALSGALVQTAGSLAIGGNAVWGEWFHGRIDDLRVYDRALTAAEIQADMRTAVRSMPAVDTTPPSVAIWAPAAGATVTGSVTLTAMAADDFGVASVQFRVSGAAVGTTDTAAPFSVAWNTTSWANGSYMVTAVARDAAGNQAESQPVVVTVANATVLVNARIVEFTSEAHSSTLPDGRSVISGYRLEVWTMGANTSTGTPYRTADLGKPPAAANIVTSNQEAFFATLPAGQQFFTTVTAIGPGGSARSSPSDIFVMQ